MAGFWFGVIIRGMKNRYFIKGLAFTGAVALWMSMAGTAQAIPIALSRSLQEAKPHVRPTAASREATRLADLAALDASRAARESGSVESTYSSLAMQPEMRRLHEPRPPKKPKTGPGSSSTAEVPDGGATGMLLGGTLSGVMVIRRKIRGLGQ